MRFLSVSDSVADRRLTQDQKLNQTRVSDKSYVIAVCLSGIFGTLGIQHFYLERWIEAILDFSAFFVAVYLFFTGHVLWSFLVILADALHTLIVTILLLIGKFNDGHGRRVCYSGQRLEFGGQK